MRHALRSMGAMDSHGNVTEFGRRLADPSTRLEALDEAFDRLYPNLPTSPASIERYMRDRAKSEAPSALAFLRGLSAHLGRNSVPKEATVTEAATEVPEGGWEGLAQRAYASELAAAARFVDAAFETGDYKAIQEAMQLYASRMESLYDRYGRGRPEHQP